jgi:hypothetical protein
LNIEPDFNDSAADSTTSEEHLTATVQRMQARLSGSQEPTVQHLMQLYGSLAARFQQDLAACPREVLLAKASALMLVQAAAQAQRAT